MVDSTLQAVLNRIEAGEDLSQRDWQVLKMAVRSRQVTIQGSADRAVIVTGDGNVVGDRNLVISGADAKTLRALIRDRSATRPEKEVKWLKAFEKEVEGRLATSLHNQILINLGKQSQPEQVHRLWDMEVKSGQITETISPDTEILEVFDRSDIAGKLLILGKPGAGKTTTLLELARALVRKASDDPTEPMPFLLNLSSWKDPKLSIKEWAIAELTTKGIGSKIGRKWLEDQKLLPLFDGLDEVRLDLQPAYVSGINQFLRSAEQPSSIVVCSRREEYELYPEKLMLNGAVYLQELIDEKIEAYLMESDRLAFWQVLSADADLLDFVRQPLVLSITVLAYRDKVVERWQKLMSTQERLTFLLDAYVERMLHRGINSRAYSDKKKPSAEQMEWWLIVLAYQLEQESQTEFLIEKMQFYWLYTERQQAAYNIFYAAINGVIGGIVSTLIYKVLEKMFVVFPSELMQQAFNTDKVWLIFLLLGLIIGTQYGLRDGRNALLNDDKIEIVEKLQWSWKAAGNKIFSEIGQGISDGSIIGFFSGLLWGLRLGLGTENFAGLNLILKNSFSGALIAALIFGIIRGLTSGLFGGIVSGLSSAEVEVKKIPNQGIWKSASNSVITAIVTATISTFIIGLALAVSHRVIVDLINQTIAGFYDQPTSNYLDNLTTYHLTITVIVIIMLIFGLAFSLVFGLRGGGQACIQHLSLRLVLFLSDSTPWNYARFLNYATERMFLQRIGGRYRFIHKLLQDHFAAMPLEQEESEGYKTENG